MIFLNGSLPSGDVVDLVDKLTHGYHAAISSIVSVVAIVIIFAIWDRATIKKDVQADFERNLDEKTKQLEREFVKLLGEKLTELENNFEDRIDKIDRTYRFVTRIQEISMEQVYLVTFILTMDEPMLGALKVYLQKLNNFFSDKGIFSTSLDVETSQILKNTDTLITGYNEKYLNKKVDSGACDIKKEVNDVIDSINGKINELFHNCDVSITQKLTLSDTK